MKRIFIAVGLSVMPLAVVWAEPEFYGRANVTVEAVDENGETGSAVESNSSRLGIKGAERLNDQLEVIYQLEYGVSFDGDDDTFSKRNIFVGLKSGWGAVVAGHFDTPLKTVQGKVDLFNDLRGDIGKVITRHDNRKSNSVMYSTPDSLGPWSANMAYISSEDPELADGKSLSAGYETDGFYAGVGLDQDVEADGAEAVRLVSTYNFNAWQLGALVEMSDMPAEDSENGWLISGMYTINRWALKAQVGRSDIVEEGGETVSLGADYAITKAATLFAFLTVDDADTRDKNQYLALGLQYKF